MSSRYQFWLRHDEGWSASTTLNNSDCREGDRAAMLYWGMPSRMYIAHVVVAVSDLYRTTNSG